MVGVTRNTEVTKGHLAMLAFSALVAGSFSLGAMAAKFVSPAALTVARFALAGSLVGAVAGFLAELGVDDIAMVGVAKGIDRDAGKEEFYRAGLPVMALQGSMPLARPSLLLSFRIRGRSPA